MIYPSNYKLDVAALFYGHQHWIYWANFQQNSSFLYFSAFSSNQELESKASLNENQFVKSKMRFIMVKLFPGSRELLETSSLMLRPKVKPQFKWDVLSTVADKTVLGVPCLCQAGYYFHTLKNTPFAFHPTAFREITQGVKNEALNKAIWSFPPS